PRTRIRARRLQRPPRRTRTTSGRASRTSRGPSRRPPRAAERPPPPRVPQAATGCSCAQPVADPPDRLEQPGLRRVGLELLAQPAYVDGDVARFERGRVAPDALHQLVAREDLIGVRGKEPEQVELL